MGRNLADFTSTFSHLPLLVDLPAHLKKYKTALQSLVDRMVKCDLNDFDLDANCDFASEM